jgi:hypothetical protein
MRAVITQKQEEYLKKIGALHDSLPIVADSIPSESQKTHPIAARIKAWFFDHRDRN